MRKTKSYHQVHYSADVIKSAYSIFEKLVEGTGESVRGGMMSVAHHDAVWDYDLVDEFIVDYRRFEGNAIFIRRSDSYELEIRSRSDSIDIAMRAPTRQKIESVFEVFESNLSASILPELEVNVVQEKQSIVIFIGHGRSNQWRDLKDHLQDKHGYKIEAYETGARAGHTIRDILEEMVGKSSFALLVMTGEDEQPDGQFRARQNVIHEAGLFQGRLGFSRAIVVMEENVEEFTNIDGVQQIRYAKNNIKETFGEILATLKREFGV